MMEREPSPEVSTRSTFDDVLAFHRRHNRARMRRVVSMLAVVTVAAALTSILWPTDCEQAARHICDGLWAQDCEAIESDLVELATPQQCEEHLDTLLALDRMRYLPGGMSRELIYLGVLRALVGSEGLDELRPALRRRSADDG